MKRTLVVVALSMLTAFPAAAADWYIVCAKSQATGDSSCVKCSTIFRVFSTTKPAGGCAAIGMRPMVFATRHEAVEWKSAKCTCP